MILNEQSKENWDNALLNLGSEFLQSWEWGEFQKSLGNQIWRLEQISPNKEITNLVFFYQHKLPLKFSFFYSPRGPIKKPEDFLETIKKIGEKENAIFWRIEPTIKEENLFSYFPSKKVIHINDVQPSQTIILDLTPTENELLKKMRPKTRYNIRLAERHQIKIRKSKVETLEKDIKIFLSLLQQTTKRDKFRAWTDNYYKKLIKTLFPNFLNLYFAEINEEPLAANIIIFFQNRATYLYGASSDNKKNLMAPYLLHFYIIKEAKNMGCKEYDFWGIDEKKWPGITRFKKGFGGKIVEYPGTFDIIFNKKWYQMYTWTKGIKKSIL